MKVKNLFKIEEILQYSNLKYWHVSPFVGSVDVDILLGGIKEQEGDNLLSKWKGNAIIVWCDDNVSRENLWQSIYRAVDIKGDESLKVWFYTSKKDEPIIIIPIDF